MRNYITLLFLLLIISVQGQTIGKKEIIGKWKTVKVEADGKISNKELKELTAIFTESTFYFQKNNKINITLPGDSTDMGEMFKDNSWVYDDKRLIYKIGTKADGYTIFGFSAIRQNGKTYFKLLDGNIKLLVVKQ